MHSLFKNLCLEIWFWFVFNFMVWWTKKARGAQAVTHLDSGAKMSIQNYPWSFVLAFLLYLSLTSFDKYQYQLMEQIQLKKNWLSDFTVIRPWTKVDLILLSSTLIGTRHFVDRMNIAASYSLNRSILFRYLVLEVKYFIWSITK